MICLQVIDRSTGAPGPYTVRSNGLLRLQDNVRCIRWEDGLALVEDKRKHLFNKSGEYIETEEL